MLRWCFYHFETPIAVERVGYEKQDVSLYVVRYPSQVSCFNIDMSEIGPLPEDLGIGVTLDTFNAAGI